MVRFSSLLAASFLSFAAYAQTAQTPPQTATPPAVVAAPPAATAAPATTAPGERRGAANYTPEQQQVFRADRKACRDEMRGKDMQRAERRKAMTSCLEARNPLFKERMAQVKNRRGEMKEVSTACREEIKRKDLPRGDARRKAMQACIVAKKPEMKKQFECQDEARAKNLEGIERRTFMRSCARPA
jgi:psiF repeat